MLIVNGDRWAAGSRRYYLFSPHLQRRGKKEKKKNKGKKEKGEGKRKETRRKDCVCLVHRSISPEYLAIINSSVSSLDDH